MLNDLIRQSNILGREVNERRAEVIEQSLSPSADRKLTALNEEYEICVEKTLKFIRDNNVPYDTVVIIEDRILRELRKKETEDRIRSEAASAKAEYESVKKEVDWLTRSMNSGLGQAESRFYEIKAKMDDFRAESARMSPEERMRNIELFTQLDREYLAAKEEYERVGSEDRTDLEESLDIANEKLEAAERKYAEKRARLESLPLKPYDIEIESASGVIARTLRGGENEQDLLAGEIVEVADETEEVEETIVEAVEPPAATPVRDETAEQNRRVAERAAATEKEMAAILQDTRAQATRDAEQRRRFAEETAQANAEMATLLQNVKSQAAASAEDRRRIADLAAQAEKEIAQLLREAKLQATREIEQTKSELAHMRESVVEQTKNELTKMREAADAELAAIRAETEKMRAEAAELQAEAQEAREAMEIIVKARKVATLSAKRTLDVARKTSAVGKTVSYDEEEE